jgi:hypothetical protein
MRHGIRLILCTDSFTIPDVVRLMNVLILRYGLDCTLRIHSDKYPRIHICTKSMPLLNYFIYFMIVQVGKFYLMLTSYMGYLLQLLLHIGL